MKQLLFLLLFPCLALAQYQGNANQKITLGEQTTADGLVYRGVAYIDTVTATSKITRANKQDTSAYILLDTVTNLLWHYKTASNGWIQAGGSTLDTATMLLPYWRSGRFSGVLPLANGGTGATTLAAAGINTGSGTANYLPKYTAATTFGNSLIYDNGSSVGIGTASPTAVFQLQLTGPDARFAMLNSSASTNNYSQMLFGNGLQTGEYAEFYRQNDNKIFHIFNSGGDIGLSTRTGSGAYIYDIYLNTSGNVGIGTLSPTEKLHVAGNGLFTGNLGVGGETPTTSGSGITFPVTQSASTNVNTLDDYEEGTWTTTFGQKANLTGTPVLSDAFYRKIGQIVYLEGKITGLSITSTNTNTSIQLSTSIPMNANITSQVGNVYTYIGSTNISGIITDWTSSDKTNLGIIIPNTLVTNTGALDGILFSITYISEN